MKKCNVGTAQTMARHLGLDAGKIKRADTKASRNLSPLVYGETELGHTVEAVRAALDKIKMEKDLVAVIKPSFSDWLYEQSQKDQSRNPLLYVGVAALYMEYEAAMTNLEASN